MTDRPVMFSAAMVRALLAGTKTQTRRLATSPLRRCEVGDRLWVREAWRTGLAYEDLAPSAMGGEEQVLFEADGQTERWSPGSTESGRLRPAMHMPRWASRLTLTVEAVRVEPLQNISDADARDEGVDRQSRKVRMFWLFGADQAQRDRTYLQACKWEYEDLWNSLHTEPGETWADNPDVLALTFRVEQRNFDR